MCIMEQPYHWNHYPGRGITNRHSSLQHPIPIQDMMRLGNIDSVLEPVNFFLGKVRQPFFGDYVHNSITSQPCNPRNAWHAVVPDIHATNYPTGRQVVNDSGATRSADAIFEVKTFTFCPTTRDNHNNNRNINPANQQTNVHERESLKVRNLEVTFASAVVVRDGNNNVIGPIWECNSMAIQLFLYVMVRLAK